MLPGKHVSGVVARLRVKETVEYAMSETPATPPDTGLRPSAQKRFLRGAAALEEGGLLLALIVLALVIGIPHPEFFDPRSIVTVLRQSAFVGIVAFGVVYLIAMVEIDLSVGALYLMAATLAALLIDSGGVDPWLAVLAAIAATSALGAL